MYIFHQIPLFAAVVNLLLGIVVFSVNPRRRQNRIFCALALALFDWNLCTYILAHNHDAERALFLTRVSGVGVLAIPALLFHLAVEPLGNPRYRKFVIGIYLVTIVIEFLIPTKYFASSVRQFGEIFRANGGPLLWFSYTMFVTTAVSALWISIRSLKSASQSLARSIRFSIAAICIIMTGGIHDAFLVLGLNHYPGTQFAIKPLGTLFASIYGLLSGYSMLSEQLFDIRISIGKTSAMGFRMFFHIGICYLILVGTAGILPGLYSTQGVSVALVVLFASTLITTYFFPKLLGHSPKQLNGLVIGDRFEYLDKVRAFLSTKPNSLTFSQFFDAAANLVHDQYNLAGIGIIIFSGDVGAHRKILLGLNNGLHDEEFFSKTSALSRYFEAVARPYLDARDGSQFGLKERAARELLRTHSFELAFPICVDGQKPIGFLVVAPRRDGRPLNKLDAEVLALLCHSIAARAERVAVERNEELQRANQAKDQFLASVNHEIRNPLNGIHGIVQMLKEHCSEGRAKYLLGTLQSCTDQLRTTMDDVLDFNRLGPEVADNHPVQTDLVELVRSITSSYDLAGDKLIMEPVQRSLAQPGSQEHTIPVWCDSGKFSHILMNYLSNALKYGIPSGARVRIEGEAIDGGKARVKLTVASTGPTLSKEEVLSLFSPLTRGQRARDTKAHGLGLGLALCKKLAQAIGGNVGVESADGETIFWFVAELPVANPANPQVPQPAFHITPRLALAIEDEPYNRLVLGYQLNRFGITPLWAVDGQSAIAAAQNRSFDLIVMDWVLPDMDGEILLSKLREVSSSPLPPIVVVSAYTTDNKRAAGLAAGAAAFVSKPIDEVKLAEALGECKLGSPIIGSPTGESEPERIDLAPLKQASADPGVVLSFLSGAEEVYTKLTANWEKNPHAAAASAHKLKGQMLLIRAKDCADLLDLLERALVDGRHPDDIERLMDAARHSFEGVTRSIRAAERLASPNT